MIFGKPNLKVKPLVSLLIITAFLLSFSLIATNSAAAAVSKADKPKYEACVKALKGKKLKDGKTYKCPNEQGATIKYFKNKNKEYHPPPSSSISSSSSNSSSSGSISEDLSTNVATDVAYDVPASDCGNTGFFAFPTWYQYLDCDDSGGINQTQTGNLPVLIILAVVDILSVLAGFAAVIYGMFGGFKLITSQGQPDGIAKGRTTILNATVGLVIAILASQIVSFIASQLS